MRVFISSYRTFRFHFHSLFCISFQRYFQYDFHQLVFLQRKRFYFSVLRFQDVRSLLGIRVFNPAYFSRRGALRVEHSF